MTEAEKLLADTLEEAIQHAENLHNLLTWYEVTPEDRAIATHTIERVRQAKLVLAKAKE